MNQEMTLVPRSYKSICLYSREKKKATITADINRRENQGQPVSDVMLRDSKDAKVQETRLIEVVSQKDITKGKRHVLFSSPVALTSGIYPQSHGKALSVLEDVLENEKRMKEETKKEYSTEWLEIIKAGEQNLVEEVEKGGLLCTASDQQLQADLICRKQFMQ